MNFNNILITLLTFVAIKIIFAYVGINNTAAPIIIAVLSASYIFVLVQVNKKKFIGKERRQAIIIMILLAIACITSSALVIFLKYFPYMISEYRILLLILLIMTISSLVGTIFV